MRVFCDTSVLVAAVLQAHVHHAPARAALNRIQRGDDTGHAFAHALVETFSVLSRMPTRPKLEPEDVLDILESGIIPHFVFVTLGSADEPNRRAGVVPAEGFLRNFAPWRLRCSNAVR